MDRQKVFRLLFHSRHGHNAGDWARVKPGVRSHFVFLTRVAGARVKTSTALPMQLLGRWNGSG